MHGAMSLKKISQRYLTLSPNSRLTSGFRTRILKNVLALSSEQHVRLILTSSIWLSKRHEVIYWWLSKLLHVPIHSTCFVPFGSRHHAANFIFKHPWSYQIYLFTNECTNYCLKNDIKIYIKIAPTCFGAVTPSSGIALSVLAKAKLR